MSILKTYSILEDVTGQAVKVGRLHSEIAASGAIPGFKGVNISDDVIEVLGDTLDDEATLDDIIEGHLGSSLDDYKYTKNENIDSTTGKLIQLGGVFENEVFSLSESAQKYWIGLKINSDCGAIVFPYKVSRKDSTRHTLTDTAHLDGLWFTISGTVAAHLQSGADLRDLVNAATTEAEVDAVQDNRLS